jgi:hypothetical protein
MRSTQAARIALVMFCLLLTAPLSRNQEYDRRDGYWWRGIDRVSKSYYVAGVVDGVELGNKLSVDGIAKDGKDYDEVSERVTASFSSQRSKYLAKVTLIQVSDGLDSFYTDSTNRRILARDAVWLVLNQIVGTPEAEMHALLENYRKAAEKE